MAKTTKAKKRKTRKLSPTEPIMAYPTTEQKEALDTLTARTRITRAILLREAIDDLLKKYRRIGGGK